MPKLPKYMGGFSSKLYRLWHAWAAIAIAPTKSTKTGTNQHRICQPVEI
jgi:hypothetical protein